MAGGTPKRHGLNWSHHPGGPQDLSTAMPGSARMKAPRGPTPAPVARGKEDLRQRVIAVDQVDSFVNALPKSTYKQLVINAEVRYDHTKRKGQTFELFAFDVPPSFTWVLTDIDFYAFVPTTALQSVPTQLGRETLVGLVSFSVKFAGKVPYRELGRRLSPYAQPNDLPESTDGWPWLDRRFGVERMPSFAVYAQEQERITVLAKIENEPRFPIAKIGVNMHGFTMAQSQFNEIWKPG